MGIAVGASILAGLVSAALGFLAGLWVKSQSRYENPQLHEGPWKLEGVVKGDVRWIRMDRTKEIDVRTHRHRAAECVVTRGMAHVDVCSCGRKRYGVFGEWA